MVERYTGNTLDPNGLKVRATPNEVAAFNRSWPCSELRATRSYWFEFDQNGDLVDTDCPENDDGSAAAAMSEDCKRLAFDDVQAAWMD
jgi:hypothetical protein